MSSLVHIGEDDVEQKKIVRSEIKTKKSAKTRSLIMECASQLMAERGNTSFRMSEISSRCGLSKGALYYYFSDKDDLLKAIYAREVERLVSSIDEAVAHAESSETALHGACKAYSDCVASRGPLAMAIIRELVISRGQRLEDRSADNNETTRALQHIVGVVMGQLERAKTEGKIRADTDTRLIAVAVCGAYAFVAMSAAEGDSKAEELSYTEDLYQMVVRGIGV
jgi:AcrR family transcriptional regulator